MRSSSNHSRCRALVALLLAAAALGEFVPPTENYDRCLTTEEAAKVAEAGDVDLFPHKVAPDQSSHWKISYHGTYKILENTEGGVDTKYLMYQCGLSAPALGVDVLANFTGIYPTPFDGKLVITSTTQIPYLEILGRRMQISAFAISQNLISSPCLSQMVIPAGIDDGSITEIPPYNATLVYEYIEANPNSMVFDSKWATDTKADRHIIISDTSENPTLAAERGQDVNEAIFEWMEFYGAIFNQEKIAMETVVETKERYNCHRDNAAIIAEERSRRLEKKPTVLWGYYYAGVGGWSVGSCPNYYCTYASNCFAEVLNSTGGSIESWGALYMTDEEFLEFGKDADVWVYPSSNWDSVASLKSEYLTQFKSMQNKQVYDYQGSGENAWFEQRYAEYDTVLLDMCDVVGHAGTTDPPHVRKWFRDVADDPVGSLGICTDPDEPFQPQITECTRIPVSVDTATPTKSPTAAPTKSPTAAPTKSPTAAPTKSPTAAPTKSPTAATTKSPTAAPTSDDSSAFAAGKFGFSTVTIAVVGLAGHFLF